MEPATSGFEFRELRRADLPTFETVIAQGLGPVERATGMDVSTMKQLRDLRGLGLWTLVRVVQALRIAPLRFFVAVEAGQVRGTALLTFREKAGYVAGVATDAPARGRGVATRLMAMAQEYTKARGKPWLALDVESENETALRVYRRLGYGERAQFRWYVGPPPSAVSLSSARAEEVNKVDAATVDWVNQQLPEPIREALPASARSLTHIEIIVRPPHAKTKVWRIRTAGRMQGLVRVHYGKVASTGFVLPVGVDPQLPADALSSLAGPALEWLRSEGASRVVLVVPDPVGNWSAVTGAWGLPLAVSTTLMVRPTSP